MKVRELVDGLDPSVDFFIRAGGPVFDGRAICRVDGNIFREYTDFDWLLDKEIDRAELSTSMAAIEVTISLEEREKAYGEEGEEF